jgi:hypothetical protein
MYKPPRQPKKVHPLGEPKSLIARGEAIAIFLAEYGKNRKSTAHEDSIELAFPCPIEGFQRSESVWRVNYRDTRIGTMFYTGRERESGSGDYIYCFQPEYALTKASPAELTDYFRQQDLRQLKKRGRPPKKSTEKIDLPAPLEILPLRTFAEEDTRKLEEKLRAKGQIL